jgi:hypothetical protein
MSHSMRDAVSRRPRRHHTINGSARLCIAVVVLWSCDSGATGLRASRAPASLEIAGGDMQSATVGSEVADPIVARVLNEAGEPVRGQLINFRVTAGGGSVFAGSALTDNLGIARDRWTLGTSVADSQRVEARAIGENGEPLVFGVFRATATADVPDSVRVVSGDAQNAIVTSAFLDSLLARVVDRFGNPVPSVVVNWNVESGDGSLAGQSTASSITGYASAKVTAGPHTGPLVIGVRAGDEHTLFHLQQLGTLPAQLSIVSGDGQQAQVGLAVNDPVVAVLDSLGNRLPGVAVTFVPSGSGSASPTSAVTGDVGTASTHWTLAKTPGDNTLTVAATGLSPITLHATAVTTVASQLVKVAGDDQTASPGTAVSIRPAVRVTDQYGNPVIGKEVNFAVTSGGGTATGVSVASGADGVATVGSWILGASVGPNSLAATATGLPTQQFNATAARTSPNIAVTPIYPLTGDVVGDEITAQVRVTATQNIASVIARIGAVQGSLTYSPSVNRWIGTLNAPATAGDTLTLVVTATDALGETADGIVRFIHDAAPLLTVTSPVAHSVGATGSNIGLSASCQDDDPNGCRSLVVTNNGATILTGTGSVNGAATLAEPDGIVAHFQFTATDSRGQTTRITRDVYIESSSKLSVLAAGTGRALDFSDGQLLSYDSLGAGIILRSASGNTTTLGRDTAGIAYGSYGYITPTGAIWVMKRPVGSADSTLRILQWNNGSLSDLGALDHNRTLGVAGNFAVYPTGSNLYRRDLVAGTNVVIGPNRSAGRGGVAANGDVAYTTVSSVSRYRNGVSTPIDDDLGSMDGAVTDGVNVAYMVITICCQTQHGEIRFYDGITKTTLAGNAPQIFVRSKDYAVNNGWTAFVRRDAAGIGQVWTRSPTGTLAQVTSGSDWRLDGLGADGSLIVLSGDRRYYVAPGGAPRDIMSQLGTVLWRDNRFVVLIGRTAYAITP